MRPSAVETIAVHRISDSSQDEPAMSNHLAAQPPVEPARCSGGLGLYRIGRRGVEECSAKSRPQQATVRPALLGQQAAGRASSEGLRKPTAPLRTRRHTAAGRRLTLSASTPHDPRYLGAVANVRGRAGTDLADDAGYSETAGTTASTSWTLAKSFRRIRAEHLAGTGRVGFKRSGRHHHAFQLGVQRALLRLGLPHLARFDDPVRGEHPHRKGLHPKDHHPEP